MGPSFQSGTVFLLVLFISQGGYQWRSRLGPSFLIGNSFPFGLKISQGGYLHSSFDSSSRQTCSVSPQMMKPQWRHQSIYWLLLEVRFTGSRFLRSVRVLYWLRSEVKSASTIQNILMNYFHCLLFWSWRYFVSFEKPVEVVVLGDRCNCIGYYIKQ